MLVRFIQLSCLFVFLATQSLLAGDCIVLEEEKFPPPRSNPEEIPKIYKSFEPRLCHFVIPAGIAAIGLSVGAVKATECSDDCDPTTETPESTSTLAFYVEGEFGQGNEGNGGGFTVEIEFPDTSLLDTIVLNLPSGIGTLSQLSNSTTDFDSGDQFTVNVTNVVDSADSITVTMRIDGVDIIAQTEDDPTTSTSFIFTIP